MSLTLPVFNFEIVCSYDYIIICLYNNMFNECCQSNMFNECCQSNYA